ERARKLGMLGARAVARRLGEVKEERKQRREQVVAEALRMLADLARQEAFLDQIEKGLMRVQRRGDEVLRADQFAVARFHADGAAILDHDARGLRVERDLAAR